MKRLFVYLFSALSLSVFVPCHASTISLNLSFGGSYSGSGTLVAQSTLVPNQYLITSISGTANGSAITQLLAPLTYPAFFTPMNDNLILYPGTNGVLLDMGGIAFSTAAGLYYNLYYNGASYQEVVSTSLTGSALKAGSLASFSLSPLSATSVTPEPSGLLLLGTGVLGMAGVLKRRMAV